MNFLVTFSQNIFIHAIVKEIAISNKVVVSFNCKKLSTT